MGSSDCRSIQIVATRQHPFVIPTPLRKPGFSELLTFGRCLQQPEPGSTEHFPDDVDFVCPVRRS